MTVYDVDMEIEAGCEFSQQFFNLGDISTRTALYFGVKETKADADAVSLVLIDEVTGLLYIAGAAATVAANGDITVDNAAAGNITVTLSDTETVKLVETSGKSYYQVKWIDAAGEAHNLDQGRVLIMSGVVRAVS